MNPYQQSPYRIGKMLLIRYGTPQAYMLKYALFKLMVGNFNIE